MINKKILMSGFSIFSALSLMGAGAFAAFTSQAVSQNNTFATGNADLQISTDNNSVPVLYGSEIPAPAVNESGIFPGFTEGYAFWLKNNSAASFNLGINTTFDDVVILGGSPTIADELTAQFTCVADSDGDNTFETSIASTGTFSVNSWDTGSAGMGALAPEDANDGQGLDEALCTMTVALPGSASNTVAGSSLRYDGVFNATQQ